MIGPVFGHQSDSLTHKQSNIRPKTPVSDEESDERYKSKFAMTEGQNKKKYH